MPTRKFKITQVAHICGSEISIGQCVYKAYVGKGRQQILTLHGF